jgi:hypothetical protein
MAWSSNAIGAPNTAMMPSPVNLSNRAPVSLNNGGATVGQVGHDLAQPLGTHRRGDVHRMDDVGEQNRHLFVRAKNCIHRGVATAAVSALTMRLSSMSLTVLVVDRHPGQVVGLGEPGLHGGGVRGVVERVSAVAAEAEQHVKAAAGRAGSGLERSGIRVGYQNRAWMYSKREGRGAGLAGGAQAPGRRLGHRADLRVGLRRNWGLGRDGGAPEDLSAIVLGEDPRAPCLVAGELPGAQAVFDPGVQPSFLASSGTKMTSGMWTGMALPGKSVGG